MSDQPYRRRTRYTGRNPRRFEDKYKEHRGDPETLAKIDASGRTPAGMHRPIMVEEILKILHPSAGERFVDGTLGFGGHAARILPLLQPDGQLLGLDIDPIELPKTAARLGADDRVLLTRHCNFAGLPRILAELGWPGAHGIMVDLGVSSMQLDDPTRGFSFKTDGPLDMRMNPGHGQTAAQYLERISAAKLNDALVENADEPHAELIAAELAGRQFQTTGDLRRTLESLLPPVPEAELSIRRTFQAIRIAVNDEFSALTSFLRELPNCLSPGGRVAVLTFHSGEDRRVKQFFKAGLRDGLYAEIAREVIRATPEERNSNPRATSAKLRWAIHP